MKSRYLVRTLSQDDTWTADSLCTNDSRSLHATTLNHGHDQQRRPDQSQHFSSLPESSNL
eukprot:4790822-Amphidinium_carterae.4